MVTTDDLGLQLCVQVVVNDQQWVDQLPPAPVNGPVSISFDDIELAARDRATVTELGYVMAGAAAVRHAEDVAHMLVPLATVRRHERWWRAVVDLADRIYDLRFGPVQMVLAEVLEVHASATRALPSVNHRPRLRSPTPETPIA